MIRRHLAIRVAVPFTLAFLSLVVPATASAHRCGRVWIPSRSLHAKVRVVHGPSSCHTARELIAAAYDAESTRDWAGFENPFRRVLPGGRVAVLYRPWRVADVLP